MPLQIVQVRNDLLSKLGIEDATLASTLALQDCVVAINGAMQMLQTAGQQYFTQADLTLTLGAGTGAYVISQSIQSIVGQALLNGTIPLRGLDSRGEYDQFDRIFLGEPSYGAAQGTPIAYFPEFTKLGSTGDIVRVTIYIAPVPSVSGTMTIKAISDAVSYVVADLSLTTEIPVAQNYTESIFLPIARMLVTRSSQFSRPDILEQLTADGQRAMAALGLSGGFPNAMQPEPGRKTIA